MPYPREIKARHRRITKLSKQLNKLYNKARKYQKVLKEIEILEREYEILTALVQYEIAYENNGRDSDEIQM